MVKHIVRKWMKYRAIVALIATYVRFAEFNEECQNLTVTGERTEIQARNLRNFCHEIDIIIPLGRRGSSIRRFWDCRRGCRAADGRRDPRWSRWGRGMICSTCTPNARETTKGTSIYDVQKISSLFF